MKGSVRKRGKRWYYYFNHEGKRIERVGGDTKSEALKALRQALTDVVDNNKSMVDASLTVQDLIDKWMNLYVSINCRPQTARGYQTCINMFPDDFKKIKIDKLKPAILQSYVNNLYGKYKRSTANTAVTTLSSMFNYNVHTLQLLNSNPMQGVRRPRNVGNNKQKEMTTYIRAEIEDILDSLELYHYSYTAVLIGYYTGLRAGEVCALEWQDVDLVEKTISISKTMTFVKGKGSVVGPPKTGSSNRVVYMPNILTNYLKKLKNIENAKKLKFSKYISEDHDFIIKTCTGKCMIPSNLNATIKRKLEYNFPDFKFHNLRHTHASMLVQSGTSIVDIQERLGHSKPSTTLDIYSHGNEDSAKAIANLLDDKFATF